MLASVTVICELFGSFNVHTFIYPRHLTSNWKSQYDALEFPIPAQSDVYRIMKEAKKLIEQSEDLKLPVGDYLSIKSNVHDKGCNRIVVHIFTKTLVEQSKN